MASASGRVETGNEICSSRKEQTQTEISDTIEKFEEISLEDSMLYGGNSDDEMDEEDIDMLGDNPIELEVEKYCQPSKRIIMKEIEDAALTRTLIVRPLSWADTNHPSIQHAITKCSQFKFSCYSPKSHENPQNQAWIGMLELTFHSSFDAEDSVDSLKRVHEEIQVFSTSNHSDLLQVAVDWKNENSSKCSVSIRDLNIMLVKNLPRGTNPQELRKLIPSSSDIIIPTRNKDDNEPMALVFFSSNVELKEILKKHEVTPLQICQTKLKLFSYLPPQLPNGLLKMDRRYREMLHLRQLKKMYKEKFTTLPQEHKKKLTDGIKRCRNFLKKDDKVRTELNLPLHSFRDLRRIKVVRDSVPIGTQWLSFSTNPKSNSSSSCAVRSKKRKVDHKKSNRSLRPPTNGNQIRSESLPLPHGNILDGTFGKNHWMIPFNFGLYNQMADMMNQITCSGGYWPSYGNGFYHPRPPFRGHPRNYSNGWRHPPNRNVHYNPL